VRNRSPLKGLLGLKQEARYQTLDERSESWSKEAMFECLCYSFLQKGMNLPKQSQELLEKNSRAFKAFNMPEKLIDISLAFWGDTNPIRSELSLEHIYFTGIATAQQIISRLPLFYTDTGAMTAEGAASNGAAVAVGQAIADAKGAIVNPSSVNVMNRLLLSIAADVLEFEEKKGDLQADQDQVKIGFDNAAKRYAEVLTIALQRITQFGANGQSTATNASAAAKLEGAARDLFAVTVSRHWFGVPDVYQPMLDKQRSILVKEMPPTWKHILPAKK